MILITGISGQIGSRLSEILHRKGIAFRGIDLVPPSKPCTFMEYDLLGLTGVVGIKSFLEPVTHVIHLATEMSNSRDVWNDWERHYIHNVMGTLSLLECLPKTIQHICFASTMVVYGTPERLPVDEDHSLKPENLYGLGKLATERYLKLFSKTKEVPVSILRYSSVYGPGRITKRAIPNMIENVLDGKPIKINGTGATQRDYIYLDDVCNITIAASEGSVDGVFNVGSGKGTSVKELAETILDTLDCSLYAECIDSPLFDLQKPDGYSFVYDIGKLQETFGHAPKTTLREGVRKTVEWHEKRRETCQT